MESFPWGLCLSPWGSHHWNIIATSTPWTPSMKSYSQRCHEIKSPNGCLTHTHLIWTCHVNHSLHAEVRWRFLPSTRDVRRRQALTKPPQDGLNMAPGDPVSCNQLRGWEIIWKVLNPNKSVTYDCSRLQQWRKKIRENVTSRKIQVYFGR